MMSRNPRQSLTTLATLAAVLLLAVLLTRLTDDLETPAAKDSLTDRLHAPLAAALTKDPGVIFKLQNRA